MARGELTPQEQEYKKRISSKLLKLQKQRNYKQIDIVRGSGIPASTLNGYLKGIALPTEKNLEKLARFFHVDKSQIDPRYSDSTAPNDSHPDIDDTLYYNGKEVPDKYKKIIKDLMDMDD